MYHNYYYIRGLLHIINPLTPQPSIVRVRSLQPWTTPTINHLLFHLTLPCLTYSDLWKKVNTWNGQLEIRPDPEDYERFEYDRHVTSDNHSTRIVQTCDWMLTLISEFRSFYGPRNPPTIFVFLNRLLPEFRTGEYCSQWVVGSDSARAAVATRYSEADEDTTTLREEGRDKLNLEEHALLPFTALMESLFGMDWRSQLKAAIVATSAVFFGDRERYQEFMDKYRLFLKE